MKKHLSLITFSLLLSIFFTGCSVPEEITDLFPGMGSETEEASAVPETAVEVPVQAPAMTTVEETPGPEEPEPVPEDPEPENSFEGYILSDEDVPENGVYLKSVKNPGEVSIVFGGDIDFDTGYANMSALRSRGGDISAALSPDLLALLRDADICMLNNEFPYSDRGTPTAGKKFTFRAPPSTVHYLTDMGVDIVGLANNHAYDHGKDALLDTFDTLDGEGIPYVGAGHNIEEASKPVYFIAGGMKIGIVAATQIERTSPPDTKEATETEPGVLRTLDPTRFISVIEEAKSHSDFVIVFVHWGSENKNDYEASQRDLAEKYEAAGADLIMGAHPHVLQGFDYVGKVPVMYSMGNFWFNSKTLDNCAVEAVITKEGIRSLRFHPCQQRDCKTTMFDEGSDEYNRIIKQMRGFSTQHADIDDQGYVTYTETSLGRETLPPSASSKPAPKPEVPAIDPSLIDPNAKTPEQTEQPQ
ncbi:MAG: CapA family protein [Lachnospiraceae bacterium]|nr:CapA family protein [Lachnospiraceae bacterium]